MTDDLGKDRIDQKTKIIVIGIGNEFRGDDGIGLAIARKLRDHQLKNVIIMESNGDGLALMNSWMPEDKVVLIDAAYCDSQPGAIHRYDAIEESLPISIFGQLSTHSFGIIEAIEMAWTLQKLPLKLIVYGIEGKAFDEGVGLTPEIEAVMPKILNEIIEDIQRL